MESHTMYSKVLNYSLLVRLAHWNASLMRVGFYLLTAVSMVSINRTCNIEGAQKMFTE